MVVFYRIIAPRAHLINRTFTTLPKLWHDIAGLHKRANNTWLPFCSTQKSEPVWFLGKAGCSSTIRKTRTKLCAHKHWMKKEKEIQWNKKHGKKRAAKDVKNEKLSLGRSESGAPDFRSGVNTALDADRWRCKMWPRLTIKARSWGSQFFLLFFF